MKDQWVALIVVAGEDRGEGFVMGNAAQAWEQKVQELV